MSQKLDAAGNHLGAYEETDLETYWFPEEYRKGKRRLRIRRLSYQLIWNITEMQVKVDVRALFPNPPGPLTTQLAQERPFEAHETSYMGESRSRALERDILISGAGLSRPPKELEVPPFQQQGNGDIEEDREQAAVTAGGALGASCPHVADDAIAQRPQVQHDSRANTGTTSAPKKPLVKLNITPQNVRTPVNVRHIHAVYWPLTILNRDLSSSLLMHLKQRNSLRPTAPRGMGDRKKVRDID